MEVRIIVEAGAEFTAIGDGAEQKAMLNAIHKLQELGDQLPFPHSSSVQGARGLWELRPRQGRSRWRALYRRIGSTIVIGAFGPEAGVNRRGFERAIASATARLNVEDATTREAR